MVCKIALAAAIVALAAATPLVAQEAGGASRFAAVATAPQAVVLSWADLIDAGRIDEAFALYVSEDFIDRADMVKPRAGTDRRGREEARRFFHDRVPRPENGRRIAEAVKVSGELVTIDGRLGQDLFLVENGRITYHWETLHQGLGSPRNGGRGTRP
jgi:predicted SnoaL-like aldol condensation-catalyzing enzyme